MLMLGLMRNDTLARYIPAIVRHDKLLHFTCFGLLAAGVMGLLPVRSSGGARGLVVLGLLLVAVASEYIQDLLPYRDFDAWDIASNLSGILLGAGVVTAAPRAAAWMGLGAARRSWGAEPPMPPMPWALTATGTYVLLERGGGDGDDGGDGGGGDGNGGDGGDHDTMARV
ncbi:hypothetical protein CXG81DRAFT_23429 [Caulochytrium protostelioides]|uniref:VanZ-like domain-containing protein n=1 Tax=Caulochytrium protostelioides TaxID=1555241 RepID=A0A4P9XEN2_9FUNG|nr:hypothetical protein CXG81DRAFT_23429 [Caulochytrium protostelioides]|eukprot:RKP04017.1 hypothetical protein CXG81DRAFT_23429 [Caulochytrium protostelioides]